MPPRRALWRPIAFGLALACAAVLARGAAPEPIPVEAFYGHASIERAVLSPSGRHVALMTSEAGPRIALAVIDLAGGAQPRVAVRLMDGDVRGFEWVNDERLVYTVIDLSAGARQQRFQSGLFSVRIDGSEPRQLVKTTDGTAVGLAARALDSNHDLLMVPEGGGDDVIVGRYERHLGELRAVHPMRVNAATQAVRALASGAPANITGWRLDPSGEPRVGVSVRDGRHRVYWKGPGQDAWSLLSDSPSTQPAFAPFFVDGTGQLFVTQVDPTSGLLVLKRFDFGSGQPEAKALVSTPGFDFDGRIIVDGARGGAAVGLRVVTDGVTSVWFDERMKRLQKVVDDKLPGRINRLSCRRCGGDDAVVLVYSWSDREPGEYWVYAPAKDAWTSIGRTRPAIDASRMGTLDLHRIRARDGLELPVWVTLPKGHDGKTRSPAVVLVHAGPWQRGVDWGWAANAQFLASRGYVVIEPEFRGSKGYGEKLFRAGWKQWGTGMQDDLADAMDWAAAKGWIDPKRVCIVGHGYGGYAVLMSLARHPDRYRCGLARNAPSDLRALFDEPWDLGVSDEAARHTMPALLGDPKADAELLAAASPVLLAPKMRSPLLLSHGGYLVDQVQLMRKALDAAGRDHEWLHLPEESNHLYRPQSRYAYAKRMESFLEKHLK